MMRALIIIDMQMDMQHRLDRGQDSVNPDAGDKIAALARHFRAQRLPVIHIRHREDHPASDFHPDAAGFPPMPCALAADGEAVFVKTTSSSFTSTGLEAHLRENGLSDLTVVGAVAGFCINSTVRHGADLGFRMTVPTDAVLGFSLPHANQSAQVIFDVTMAHLGADFAALTDTAALLDR